MAVTKLSLYNDALILLGQRVLLTDTEDRPSRHKLDALYDNGAVDYCFEIVKPKFAVKLSSLTGVAPTLTTAFTNEATLPSTFQALVGVFADATMDQQIKRYTHEEDKILSDFATIFVRFVQDFTTVGLTNMSHSFGRVVSAYLARELSISIDPDETENMDVQLEKRMEISAAIDSATEPMDRGLADTTLTDAYRKIYNDALMILGLARIVSNTDDSLRKNQLDIARDSEVVEAMLEDMAWQFGLETKESFFNPAIEPEFGQPRAHDKPADMHRLNGVWVDEYRQYPLVNYIDEGAFLYTDYETIYIEFVSNDFLADPAQWPSYFKRLLAARLAIDAGPSIPGSNMDNAKWQYEDRRQEALSTDAMRSPPTHLVQGSWSRSRDNRYPTANRNRP